MLRKSLYAMASLGILLSAGGCREDESWTDLSVTENRGYEFSIQGQINQVCQTRVNDSGFADGDVVGIYVVNKETESATLLPSGNHADNVKFTFDEKGYQWTSAYPVYWKDKTTPVDIYGYYPYSDDTYGYTANPAVIDFAVARNQNTAATATSLASYEASDFLWAKAEQAQPTQSAVSLTFTHVMACVEVVLVEGEDFDEGEWNEATKAVVIQNTHIDAQIDLTTGSVVPRAVDNEPTAIIPLSRSTDFRAVVVPQTVEADATLIAISVGTDSYNFKREEGMQYYAGKLHRFTIRVDKAEKGDYKYTVIDEAILPWESDPVSHSAETKRYIVVNCPEAGQLGEALKAMNIDTKQIKNLKVVGEMTDADFEYLRNNVPYLEAINLYEAKMKNCTFEERDWWGADDFEEESGKRFDNTISYGAFNGMVFMNYVVFPKDLEKIGGYAFRDCPLLGQLIIPEGVTDVGSLAFSNDEYAAMTSVFTGSLVLPSTLKNIYKWAFRSCLFTGELIIPESVENIGGYAFGDCVSLESELHLPSNLKYIGASAFTGCSGLTGRLEIPQQITNVPHSCFSSTGITSVSLHSGVVAIEAYAFYKTKLQGDLQLPSSLKKIQDGAFRGTNITHVNLPESLEIFGGGTDGWNGVFEDCKFLQDTITIPSAIRRVPEFTFCGCDKLTAVILPSTCEQLDWECFGGCYSLSYIRCDATTPPELNDGAFEGVAKDNFTIEVPGTAVASYRATSPWNEFKRISEYRGFVCRPSKANVLNAGGTREIVLNADASWTVTTLPDWCSISATSGYKKTALTVKIDAMTHGSADREGQIVFQLDDSDEHVTTLDIKQYDYEYDEDSELTLQQASKGRGINLVLIGDGYDAGDIATGVYLEDMKQEAEYFFDVHPYREYRDYFNVYTVFSMSYDSGVGTVNTLRDTKFESSFGSPGNDRLSCNFDEAAQYIYEHVNAVTESNVGQLTAIVLANSELYDGVTTLYSSGTAIALTTKSTQDYPYDARGVTQHEAGGHAFAKLADEYIYHRAYIHRCGCTCCGHLGELQAGQEMGWFQNLSISGRYADIPWYHLMNDARYTDIVDVWEGGFFHSHGLYRSEYNSCMNNNVAYFSTWCRELIVRRIMEYAGETFSYDDFVANDSREYGTDFTNIGTRAETPFGSYGTRLGQTPIIKKDSPITTKSRK